MDSRPQVKTSDDWAEVFSLFRIDSVHGGEVITGRLRPGLERDSPEVRRRLEEWPGTFEWRSGPEAGYLILFRRIGPRRERWWLHVTLLLLTVFSTIVAGSLLSGEHPIDFLALPLAGGWWFPLPVELNLPELWRGLPFGLVLVAILALHESGHYVAARLHGISVTPPYFIPFPPYLSIIGTLGAFIRLRSPVMNRRSLLDVGAAGPVLSFLASLPVVVWGLLYSRVVPAPPAFDGHLYLVRFVTEEFWLGGSLAFSGLARLTLGFAGEGEVLVLHPVAFAGWIGLFITALNLLPISQLDGGHVLYALLGRLQGPLAWAFFLALVPLGFLWAGWWVWAGLVLVVGRGRVRHPAVFNAEQRLTPVRFWVALASIAIFVVCFVPTPFQL